MFIKIDSNLLTKDLNKVINEYRFGRINENFLLLNYFEIYFLNELNRGFINNLMSNDLFEKIKKYIQLNFDKYSIFKDLINKNFVVKSGLKYGAHFRVYFKKDYDNKEHSKYLVYILNPKKTFESEELISLFRIANSVKKRVLLAFIDEECNIVYYENKWLRI